MMTVNQCQTMIIPIIKYNKDVIYCPWSLVVNHDNEMVFDNVFELPLISKQLWQWYVHITTKVNVPSSMVLLADLFWGNHPGGWGWGGLHNLFGIGRSRAWWKMERTGSRNNKGSKRSKNNKKGVQQDWKSWKIIGIKYLKMVKWQILLNKCDQL